MSVLRPCPPALAVALEGGVKLWMADLFLFTLQDGSTTYRWTSWDYDLTVGGDLYSSRKPWLNRTKWNLVNTMQVPEITVILRALNDSFAGGGNIKTQIHNGLFDGATFLLSRAYMPAPADVTTLGTIDIFGGIVGEALVIGTHAEITCKGKNNNLAQYAPRNVFGTGCLHAFCDPGCTLSRAAFTTSFSVGSGSPTAQFIPWAGSPPGNYANYLQGTVRMTSGAAAGQSRTVANATSSGLTLVYPLYDAPAPGDTFTAFQGCDKTKDSGSGQSCTDRSNTQNYRGFPFVPPPNAAY